jgi:tripartite-type tricarboxylate transporter receptor subunit TctC
MTKFFSIALLLLSCSLIAGTALAQTYPARPITFVVTAAAGGVTDVVARAVGQKLSEAWSQQVIIENKGGAAHVTGAMAVAKAAPDGYTLMVAEAGLFTINPTLYGKGKIPYDEEKDFIPVSGLVRINQALLASRELPIKTVGELIALAKQSPGKITYGTAGIGSGPHMNITLFELMTGTKFTPVHYRGAAPALNDVIASHVNIMSVSMSLALPAHRAGQLKILGVGSAQRLAPAADIPTVAEGGVPGYEAVTWFGLFAPAGTPPEVVAKLHAGVQRVFAEPTFREKFIAPQMFQPMPQTPDQFAAFIKSEAKKWSKVVRDANLKVE